MNKKVSSRDNQSFIVLIIVYCVGVLNGLRLLQNAASNAKLGTALFHEADADRSGRLDKWELQVRWLRSTCVLLPLCNVIMLNIELSTALFIMSKQNALHL